MKGSIDQLNELIEIARDGQKFYREAAAKVRSPAIKEVFREQAEARGRLIKDLSQYVAADGETPSRETTLLGASRELYADMRARLSSDRDAVYIGQLEQMEDRLLEHYERALEETGDESVRRILLGHLPTVHAAHDRMSALKEGRHAA